MKTKQIIIKVGDELLYLDYEINRKGEVFTTTETVKLPNGFKIAHTISGDCVTVNLLYLTVGNVRRSKHNLSVKDLLANAFLIKPREIEGKILVVRCKDDNYLNVKISNIEWIYADKQDNIRAYSYRNYIITHPDGRRERVSNLTAWCRNKGFRPVRMFEALYGDRRTHYKKFKCEYADECYGKYNRPIT